MSASPTRLHGPRSFRKRIAAGVAINLAGIAVLTSQLLVPALLGA